MELGAGASNPKALGSGRGRGRVVWAGDWGPESASGVRVWVRSLGRVRGLGRDPESGPGVGS